MRAVLALKGKEAREVVYAIGARDIYSAITAHV